MTVFMVVSATMTRGVVKATVAMRVMGCMMLPKGIRVPRAVTMGYTLIASMGYTMTASMRYTMTTTMGYTVTASRITGTTLHWSIYVADALMVSTKTLGPWHLLERKSWTAVMGTVHWIWYNTHISLHSVANSMGIG